MFAWPTASQNFYFVLNSKRKRYNCVPVDANSPHFLSGQKIIEIVLNSTKNTF